MLATREQNTMLPQEKQQCYHLIALDKPKRTCTLRNPAKYCEPAPRRQAKSLSKGVAARCIASVAAEEQKKRRKRFSWDDPEAAAAARESPDFFKGPARPPRPICTSPSLAMRRIRSVYEVYHAYSSHLLPFKKRYIAEHRLFHVFCGIH